MNCTKGYLIVDENGKYVVGYVKENDSFKYIAYDKTERCALRPIKGILTVTRFIERLYKRAEELGEHHQFSIKEI
jgi:hypothetical protein